MWDGVFAPFQKHKLEASFDPENTDDVDSRPPEDIIGIMTVSLSGKEYRWEVTYQDFLDFEVAGFDSSFLNDNFPINYVGDWGWPWGRTEGSGWWEGHRVQRVGDNGRYTRGAQRGEKA